MALNTDLLGTPAGGSAAPLVAADVIDPTSTTAGLVTGTLLDQAIKAALSRLDYATGTQNLDPLVNAGTVITGFTGGGGVPGYAFGVLSAAALTANTVVLTDVPIGGARWLVVQPAAGVTVDLTHAGGGVTFTPTANSALLPVVGDGVTRTKIALAREGAVLHYTIDVVP